MGRHGAHEEPKDADSQKRGERLRYKNKDTADSSHGEGGRFGTTSKEKSGRFAEGAILRYKCGASKMSAAAACAFRCGGLFCGDEFVGHGEEVA